MLAVFVLVGLTLYQVGEAAANFYHPQPMVVLSQDSLFCQWRVRWVDIVDVSLRPDFKAGDSIRVEFAPGRSPLAGKSSASCQIDGLKTASAEVYEAVDRQWQFAKANAALQATPTEAWRMQVNQIPLGATREIVAAVLGRSLTTEPNGDGQVSFFPQAADGQPTGLSPNIWRVVTVYFDENQRVSKVAVYRATNGMIVDDFNHETLPTSFPHYNFVRMALAQRPVAANN
jgi:hypothetical protein